MEVETHEYNVYELARLADTLSPDSPDSPGGEWLTLVRDAFEAWPDDAGVDSHAELSADDIPRMALDLVPIYTHTLWLTFVDLGAYREDINELVSGDGGMTAAAMTALRQVAERLLGTLLKDRMAELEEFREALSSDRFSLDLQIRDVVDMLNYQSRYMFDKEFPEWNRLVWDDAWVDCDASDVDPDYMSWVIDWLEQDGKVEIDGTRYAVQWEDGEPWAVNER